MLDKKPIEKVLFIDIETTSQYPTLAEVPTRLRELFKKKFEKDIKEKSNEIASDILRGIKEASNRNPEEEIYDQKAPLLAEFNKIICISIGAIQTKHAKTGEVLPVYKLHVKSFCGEDEKKILTDFASAKPVAEFYTLADGKTRTRDEDQFNFCAHNGKIFDFPVLAWRMIYNQLPLPYILDYGEKKPWDVTWFIDTKEIRKMNVFDANISLDLLAASFDIESSKTIMSGDMVKHVYWEQKANGGLKNIQEYCEFDVLTLARLYLKMKGINTTIEKAVIK